MNMIKRFSHLVACLLLVLMPLQALAAANMMVCHSVMQSKTTSQSTKAMSCHQMNGGNKTTEEQHLSCKARCATVCANMCALTVSVQANIPESLSTTIDVYHDDYTSIAQQRLQRPPISFI